ncbi:hypothetical protein KCV03_g10231, partial [Aureobasidium melanogenum]
MLTKYELPTYCCPCFETFKNHQGWAQHKRDSPPHNDDVDTSGYIQMESEQALRQSASLGLAFCVCGKVFKNTIAMRQHRQDAQPAPISLESTDVPTRNLRVTCIECYKRFRDKIALDMHMLSSHGLGQPSTKTEKAQSVPLEVPALCNCGKIFKSEDAMRQHMRDTLRRCSRAVRSSESTHIAMHKPYDMSTMISRMNLD